jgi:hypothetical protein
VVVRLNMGEEEGSYQNTESEISFPGTSRALELAQGRYQVDVDS